MSGEPNATARSVAAGRACPSCAAPMELAAFGRLPHGQVDLEICYGCHAIWFDAYESAQLTPGAVIQLFRRIHEHRDAPARPLGDNPRCPECRALLAFTQDIQRTNRLAYHRCPEGHGRLTTFLQFLREKNFVRSLSAPEVERLRATVSQVRCSGCGAPVDIAREAACGFCRSPLSVLDADAVAKTLAALAHAERRRTSPDPAEILAALSPARLARHESPWMRDIQPMGSSPAIVDLVVEGIGALLSR